MGIYRISFYGRFMVANMWNGTIDEAKFYEYADDALEEFAYRCLYEQSKIGSERIIFIPQFYNLAADTFYMMNIEEDDIDEAFANWGEEFVEALQEAKAVWHEIHD